MSVNHDQITVHCTAVGMPKPTFSFFLPKTKIDPDSIKTKVLDDGRTVVAEYTFTGGERQVSCTVSNIHGTDKARIFLPKSKSDIIFLDFHPVLNK